MNRKSITTYPACICSTRCTSHAAALLSAMAIRTGSAQGFLHHDLLMQLHHTRRHDTVTLLIMHCSCATLCGRCHDTLHHAYKLRLLPTPLLSSGWAFLKRFSSGWPLSSGWERGAGASPDSGGTSGAGPSCSGGGTGCVEAGASSGWDSGAPAVSRAASGGAGSPGSCTGAEVTGQREAPVPPKKGAPHCCRLRARSEAQANQGKVQVSVPGGGPARPDHPFLVQVSSIV